MRADDYIVTCADGKIFCPLNDRHCQSPDPDRDGIDTNDNCPFHYNPDQGDFDLDGKGDVCDCGNTDPLAHPGASEINNGLDEGCPGDPGYSMMDDITGTTAWTTNGALSTFEWAAQQDATEYEAIRSGSPTFETCVSQITGSTFWDDAETPAPGEVWYYVVRTTQPNAGSWGARDTGQERIGLCGP